MKNLKQEFTRHELMTLHTAMEGMILKYQNAKLTKGKRYQNLITLRKKLEGSWEYPELQWPNVNNFNKELTK
jgi:hypothetical protein